MTRTTLVAAALLGAALLIVATIRGLAPANGDGVAAAPVSAPPAKATPPAPAPGVLEVAIVVYDGVELLDFAGPAEVLAVAAGFAGHGAGPALELYVVGATGAPVVAQGFVTITPQRSLATGPAPDLVVIPGGQSRALSDDPEMMTWLAERAGDADAILTVCTGAFPLARLGALDGLEVTTWYGAIERLQALAPAARVAHGRRFVDNGRIITTAGVSAGIDGALHLVARLFGRRVADQTARYMEYHWTPEPYLAASYAYWDPRTDDRGRAMQRAELAFEEQRWADAIALYRDLAADPSAPGHQAAVYNLACAAARAGDDTTALEAIGRALAAGVDREQALADPDLASIRDRIAALPGRGAGRDRPRASDPTGIAPGGAACCGRGGRRSDLAVRVRAGDHLRVSTARRSRERRPASPFGDPRRARPRARRERARTAAAMACAPRSARGSRAATRSSRRARRRGRGRCPRTAAARRRRSPARSRA